MTARTLRLGTVLVVALLIGGGVDGTAGSDGSTPANCVGEVVSAMAREHSGMAAATDHHNEMHGTDLSVGEHQAHIREEMCGR